MKLNEGTKAPPGSKEKVQLLAARYAARMPLFRADDKDIKLERVDVIRHRSLPLGGVVPVPPQVEIVDQ